MKSFVEICRTAKPFLEAGTSENGGAFTIGNLCIIASWERFGPHNPRPSPGAGWDHVSVSRRDRCPTWDEMELVKRAFFKDDEIAVQFHVPPSDHINIHPHCLHLWRSHVWSITLPPSILV